MDKNVYVNQFHYLFRSYHYAHGGLFGWGSENGTCATVSTMRTNHYGEADEDARCKVNFVAGLVKVDGKNVLMDNGKALEYQPLEVKQILLTALMSRLRAPEWLSMRWTELLIWTVD